MTGLLVSLLDLRVKLLRLSNLTDYVWELLKEYLVSATAAMLILFSTPTFIAESLLFTSISRNLTPSLQSDFSLEAYAYTSLLF